jgi:hypothetical protein
LKTHIQRRRLTIYLAIEAVNQRVSTCDEEEARDELIYYYEKIHHGYETKEALGEYKPKMDISSYLSERIIVFVIGSRQPDAKSELYVPVVSKWYDSLLIGQQRSSSVSVDWREEKEWRNCQTCLFSTIVSPESLKKALI